MTAGQGRNGKTATIRSLTGQDFNLIYNQQLALIQQKMIVKLIKLNEMENGNY